MVSTDFFHVNSWKKKVEGSLVLGCERQTFLLVWTAFMFLPSPPPPPTFIFWLLFHFSRGQNRESRSSVFLCSETKRKRLLRRLGDRTEVFIWHIPPKTEISETEPARSSLYQHIEHFTKDLQEKRDLGNRALVNWKRTKRPLISIYGVIPHEITATYPNFQFSRQYRISLKEKHDSNQVRGTIWRLHRVGWGWLEALGRILRRELKKKRNYSFPNSLSSLPLHSHTRKPAWMHHAIYRLSACRLNSSTIHKSILF